MQITIGFQLENCLLHQLQYTFFQKKRKRNSSNRSNSSFVSLAKSGFSPRLAVEMLIRWEPKTKQLILDVETIIQNMAARKAADCQMELTTTVLTRDTLRTSQYNTTHKNKTLYSSRKAKAINLHTTIEVNMSSAKLSKSLLCFQVSKCYRIVHNVAHWEGNLSLKSVPTGHAPMCVPLKPVMSVSHSLLIIHKTKKY